MANYIEVISSEFVNNLKTLRNLYIYEASEEVEELFDLIQQANAEKDFFELLSDRKDTWTHSDLLAFLENEKIQILDKLEILSNSSPFYDLIQAANAYFNDDNEDGISVGDWTLNDGDDVGVVNVYYKGALFLQLDYHNHTIDYIGETELPLNQVVSTLGADSFRIV